LILKGKVDILALQSLIQMKKYPMAKPYMGREEERAVIEVLRSGTLSLGPKLAGFEKEFAKFIGTRYACAVDNGTAALHLILLSLGIQKEDEVITSPFSFISSANAVLYHGAKPVFADVDPVTFNIDPKEVEKKITKKTKAILPVHIFGQSADMDPIMKLAKKHKLFVVEDACESLAACYKGRHVGTEGHAAAFSFYPNKQMTTGEGGVVVTNDKKIYELCRSLRNQGRAENMQWLDHERLGFNYRMHELSAAIGLAQLAKLPRMVKERRQIAGWYDQFLAPLEKKNLLFRPQVADHNTHSWFLYVARVSPEINRDKVIGDLAKIGVSSKPYLPSIHLFGFYSKKFGFKQGDFPVSEGISRSSLALPFYIGLKKSDVAHICRNLEKVLENSL